MKHQYHHSDNGSNTMNSNTNDWNTVKFLPTTTTIHISSNGSGSSYSNHMSNRHSGNFQDIQQLSIDQLLIVMDHINISVKNNEFTASLANNIFLLCQQLKLMGGMLEQTHKIYLNKVFISLRQACCRDAGQLGTPCRLKIMELIELRAMGWRPNLAHTQYYLNHQNKNENKDKMTNSVIGGPTTFNTIPVSAINFVPATTTTATPLFVTGDQTAAAGGTAQGFYIIPATNGIPPWGTTIQSQSVHQSTNDSDTGAWTARNNLFNNCNLNKIFPNDGTFPVVHMRQKSNNKIPQIREEITIRNADSGKIMGVKGRRIAVVEELSKTVVSFQKVDSKSKDRILTITGTSQDSIEYAKKLIEETIRRNVSPSRELIENDEHISKEKNDNNIDNMGIKIETEADGTLRLSCSNPQYLTAAQNALTDYINRIGRSNRLSMDEKELRRERRKSMPLNMGGGGSSGGGGGGGSQNDNNNISNNNRNSFHHCHNRGSFREKRSFAGSTPNLIEGVVGSSGTNQNNKISYTRKELQAIAEQNNTNNNEIDEPIVRMINETIPEISRIRID